MLRVWYVALGQVMLYVDGMNGVIAHNAPCVVCNSGSGDAVC